jgi:hypothetical protein
MLSNRRLDQEERINNQNVTMPDDILDERGNYRAERPCPQPPDDAEELATLLGFLERQRATFAWKCGGLDAIALRIPLPPSQMTLSGMLKHLARFEDDMSSEWLLGQPQQSPWNEVDWHADPTWDWTSAANDPPALLYRQWQDAVNRSRTRFTSTLQCGDRSLSAPREPLPSPRYILLNMIEEYAWHNGHADLIRESIDGLTGHDPPA